MMYEENIEFAHGTRMLAVPQVAMSMPLHLTLAEGSHHPSESKAPRTSEGID
jgi:hypothetical protein